MLTDTTGIRQLARQLRERAEEIRAEAAFVRRRTDDVPWQGRAADAMRTQVAAQLTVLAATADLHDDAAAALDRHAGAVESVGGAVAGVLHDLGSLL
ncbi:hypothetical protein [Nocardioides conyzicola]|uniref:WXG100 family type VII secretion target n=1 Tax=Nocardioides conyzicola TaxID=1651781 RepID=A0ABP8X7U2_9ACTN